MQAVTLDPTATALEWLYRQFGPGVAIVAVLSIGFFYVLRRSHAQQTVALAESNRQSLDHLERAQDKYQAQMERLTDRFEDALTGLESRVQQGAREQSAIIHGLERSVDALQANVVTLTVLVGRIHSDFDEGRSEAGR